MVTTAADLIEQTRDDFLTSGLKEQRNKLAAPYTVGGGSLTFLYPLDGITQGSLLAIGQNTFYVWATDPSSKTATVTGGSQGSIDATANTGDEVQVNPRYTPHRLFRALNQELAGLSSPGTGLFQVKQMEFAYNASIVGYDLTGVSNINSVIEVRYDIPGGDLSTPRIDRSGWRLERNNTVGEFASTYSLKVLTGGYPGRNVTVVYRAQFDQLTDLSTTTAAAGLPDSMLDIAAMGTALRVGLGREVRRNDTGSQGDSRRAEEVVPGAIAASWRPIAQQYQRRINDEASRLAQQYPVSR